MMTHVLRVHEPQASDRAIAESARILREGGLVAFATETVYGLGARVGDSTAVERIFQAKARPSRVPLIVHVSSLVQALEYVKGYDSQALTWAKRFWPGPLTLVAPRSDKVPDAVTGGSRLVGVRVPSHPAALALLDMLGEAIAAPSANMHGQLPPVRAQHVVDGLGGRIEAVLDAGPCPGGLESTVVDVSETPPIVLRRGAIGLAALGVQLRVIEGKIQESTTGWLRLGKADKFNAWVQSGAWKHEADEQQYIDFTRNWGEKLLSQTAAQTREHLTPRCTIGRICIGAETKTVRIGSVTVQQVCLANNVTDFASKLYEVLHQMRYSGCKRVWVDKLPEQSGWDAVKDRVKRLTTLATKHSGPSV